MLIFPSPFLIIRGSLSPLNSEWTTKSKPTEWNFEHKKSGIHFHGVIYRGFHRISCNGVYSNNFEYHQQDWLDGAGFQQKVNYMTYFTLLYSTRTYIMIYVLLFFYQQPFHRETPQWMVLNGIITINGISSLTCYWLIPCISGHSCTFQ